MVYRGTRQLGFTVADLSKGMFYFFTRLYLHLLLSIIHPMGRKKRLEVKGDLLTPKVVAISVKELRRIYRPEQEQEITARRRLFHLSPVMKRECASSLREEAF